MLFEVAHQIGLIPLLIMIGVGRKLPRPYWWVAFAFFVSWVGDSLAHFSEGAMAASYLWLPLQFWLVLCAFTGEWYRMALYASALSCTAVISWNVMGPGPDVLLTFLGSVAILWIAKGSLALPLYIYFGLGSLAYMMMIMNVGGGVMGEWVIYQCCRLAAFLAFIGIIAPQVIRNRGPADVEFLD